MCVLSCSRAVSFFAIGPTYLYLINCNIFSEEACKGHVPFQRVEKKENVDSSTVTHIPSYTPTPRHNPDHTASSADTQTGPDNNGIGPQPPLSETILLAS
jgi:hypothetical protein